MVLDLGKASIEKSRLLSGIAQISERKKNPTPNSGNLVLFFPDVKTTFYAYDRKTSQDCETALTSQFESLGSCWIELVFNFFLKIL